MGKGEPSQKGPSHARQRRFMVREFAHRLMVYRSGAGANEEFESGSRRRLVVGDCRYASWPSIRDAEAGIWTSCGFNKWTGRQYLRSTLPPRFAPWLMGMTMEAFRGGLDEGGRP